MTQWPSDPELSFAMSSRSRVIASGEPTKPDDTEKKQAAAVLLAGGSRSMCMCVCVCVCVRAGRHQHSNSIPDHDAHHASLSAALPRDYRPGNPYGPAYPAGRRAIDVPVPPARALGSSPANTPGAIWDVPPGDIYRYVVRASHHQ
jgi:hypothetical protein